MKNFTQEISSMTSESEDRMLTNGYIDSPSIEEVSSGGNVAGGCPLKKGPWTTAEDAILVEYVSKHGEGNWNAVQKHSGLSRCGKSCRLRWANHLRPDLKKGAFTADEERCIVELHAKMGNKWARMAAELPGRTDNEIKNFWNTRIKRRQRAGLPIYPPDICMQALLNENNPSQDMTIFSTGDTPHSDLLPTNNLEIPSVEFTSLELNPQFYTSFLDIPAGSNSFLFSAIHPAKRLRESELVFNQYQDDDSQKIAKSFGASPYDRSLSSSSCLFSGSHAFLNGNSSSSEPISWAMKMELPSLQYADTQMDTGWGPPSSPLPSLESVDTLIQTLSTEQTQSDCLSPRNNGLLESVLYESQTHKNSKKNSCQKICDASTPVDGPDSLSKLNDAEWDMYAEPNSPLGHSVGSVFSECTPISGSSSDEHNLVKTLPVKQEKLEWFSTISDEKDGLNFSRPDYLLDSNWFGPCSERGKNHSILTDAIGALLCEEFSSDSRQIGAAGRSHESCEWDMSTTICEISEHH